MRYSSNRAENEQVLTKPSQLSLGILKPHAPVKACSRARWVKSTLSNAGIDTTAFSAHSTWGAGVMLSDVIHQEDWLAAQVFIKFYLSPPVVRTLNPQAVLTITSVSNIHADIEPEHSMV